MDIFKKVIVILLSYGLLYLNITSYAVVYVLLAVSYISYLLYKGYRNEVALALVLFGFSFFGLLNKVFGIQNLLLIFMSIASLFGYSVLTGWGSEGKLSYKLGKYHFFLFLYVIAILLSITHSVFYSDYQGFKVQLLFLWMLIFLMSIHTFDNRIHSFNYEIFLYLSYFLFIAHFSHLLTDQGLQLSPIEYWQKYSIIDEGIRGTQGIDVITPSRYAGMFIVIFAVYFFDFNPKKLYSLLLVLPSFILIIIVQTRQAFVGLALALFIVLIYYVLKNESKNKFYSAMSVVIFLAGIMWYNNYLSENNVESRILDESEGSGREKVWHDAVEALSYNSGVGFGDYSMYASGFDWPHNIFLETFIEVGFFAVVILVFITLLMLVEVINAFISKKNLSKLQLFLLAATLYFFAMAQFSADIPRNMFFFYVLALYIAIDSSKSKLNSV